MRLTDKEITDALRAGRYICSKSWSEKKLIYFDRDVLYDQDNNPIWTEIALLETDDWEIVEDKMPQKVILW